MMRLIDADKLEKEWTIASPEPYDTDAVEVLESISDAPTIDVVPVVRCKDCKYHKECTHFLFDDDFCSRGEYKTNTVKED